MGNIGHAFFAERPRTIDDLMQPHLSAHEREYQIVKTIELEKMDYENFITDKRWTMKISSQTCWLTVSSLRTMLGCVRGVKSGNAS